MSSEKSIASARASVMIYDDVNKKWMPSGSSSGLSKVHVFQHQVNNTFRVVGRKLQNQEVVINCVILKSLKYNQATATFHQWRDNKQVYGLNFSSKEDADAFAGAMLFAVEVLASTPRANIQQFPSPPVYPQTNGQYEEDMGYRPIIPLQQPPVIIPTNQTQPNLVYSEHNLNHMIHTNNNNTVNNNSSHSQLPTSLSHHQQDR
uniref:Protein enabled n=1 Tax=Cacopsylla melanoneura TaxID=428564 RepID=A0A8D8ZST0_9HEMI